MNDVTSGFGSYDPTEICEEFMQNADDSERDEILPKHVGGFRVHLLLVIKNTNPDSPTPSLQPFSIFPFQITTIPVMI